MKETPPQLKKARIKVKGLYNEEGKAEYVRIEVVDMEGNPIPCIDTVKNEDIIRQGAFVSMHNCASENGYELDMLNIELEKSPEVE